MTVTSYLVRWRGHTSADDEWLRLEEHCPDPALVGRPVLFYWPTDGWVRGTVARRSLAAGHSHVVRYDRRSALGAVVADSLLDAASHGPGGRWVLLCPVR